VFCFRILLSEELHILYLLSVMQLGDKVCTCKWLRRTAPAQYEGVEYSTVVTSNQKKRSDCSSMDPSSSPPDPLQDLVAALRQALATLPAPAPTPPATTSADTITASSAPLCSSPMAQPAPYSGLVEDCNGFLLQCSLVLEMQPHLYPTKRSKVAFVITQLRGQALLWAESLWSQDSPVMQSYARFVEHFKDVFGKPSCDSSVGEELCKFRQGKLMVTEYAIQFRTLAAKSSWNEQALLAAYRQGLRARGCDRAGEVDPTLHPCRYSYAVVCPQIPGPVAPLQQAQPTRTCQPSRTSSRTCSRAHATGDDTSEPR
ncbi:hypothetical protein QTP86_004160, partial [Hemibagrus guttatus]